MSEFWQQLLGTLAGNTILVGLAGFLGKIYIDRIARKEQSAIDNQAREHTTKLEERLKQLEQNHEKLLAKGEHFHQISQETYQRLFEMKIDTYKHLNKIILEYRIPITFDTEQIDSKGFDNKNLLIFKKFQNIVDYIGTKALYITPNLNEEVKGFRISTTSKICEINNHIAYYSVEMSSNNDVRNLEKYEANEYSGLYTRTVDIRAKIIKQIEDDILEISHYIHGNTL